MSSSIASVSPVSRYTRLAAQAAALAASSVLLTACYVVPVQPVPGGPVQSPAAAVQSVAPVNTAVTFNARMYPANDLAARYGMVQGTVTNDMHGRGIFTANIQGETYTGEATLVPDLQVHPSWQALRAFLTPDAIRWQYEHGAPDPAMVPPDGSALDAWYMLRPQVEEIQLDLFLDYASNIALYPAFQAYFRDHRPRLLAIWGRNDPFFLPPGAEAYRRDLPDAEIRFLDTGHFALETHAAEIAQAVAGFLKR